MMNLLAFALLVAATGTLPTCVGQKGDSTRNEKVSYYDRNDDGKVDLEKHEHPDAEDSDREFRDDDFNGRYEKEILLGIGVVETAMEASVPIGVKLEPLKVQKK